MSSILKAFNAHLLDFINDIISVFPNNRSLKVTKTAFLTWKRINPKSIIEIWKINITDKYKIQIEKGDCRFFIEKNYTEDISCCDNPSEILASIEELRKPISEMSKDSQNKAIKYIQNLTKLSQLYYAS